MPVGVLTGYFPRFASLDDVQDYRDAFDGDDWDDAELPDGDWPGDSNAAKAMAVMRRARSVNRLPPYSNS